ncbi:MAG: hypothetical protein AMXMBFR13_08840 [Phycisphaerae bacterium]
MRYLLSLCLVASATLAASPRNVVLMIADDHGLDAGCYGHSVIKTPGLDRLARQGTRFTTAFAAVASCSASRSVIMSGMYNHTTGQYGHAHGEHHFRSFEKLQTLPAMLKDAGYRTAIAGKHHVEPIATYPFETWLKGGGRDVAALADSARGFMAQKSDRPFFLLVGFVDPHRAGPASFANEQNYRGIEKVTYRPEQMRVPPFLPDSPESRAELAEYAQSVSRMDQGVGKVLDAIEETGHAGDTLVIYCSDNGIPFPGAKTTLYDPGIHLPLLIRSPLQKRQAVACDAMASWVDIAPTIYTWAGVQPPKQVAGRSLLGVLDEEQPKGWDAVYGSHTFHEITMYYPMRMIRTRTHKYILNLAWKLDFPFASDLWASTTWQGVLRRGDAHYGRRTVEAYLHRPREELYDLASDPHETHNLAADPAGQVVLKDLRARLKEWQVNTRDPWLVKYDYE